MREVTVEEVEHMRRVALVWSEPCGEPSLVELTLDDLDSHTRLTVIEIPLLTLDAAAVSIDPSVAASHGPSMLAAIA